MLIISGPVHTTVNSMAYQELEQRLTEYGLQLNEIRTYITLAMRGPKKASDLAKACELSRMDTYRILKRLESKGLIETALQKPMRFAAVPPEKAFEILIGTAKEKISILEQERNRFLELWRSIPQEPLDSEGEKFRILWGRVDFFSTIKRMCSAAARRICILTTRNGLSRLYHSGLDDLIQDLKGVDVKILAEIDNANLEAAERFASIVAVRHVKPTSAQFVIIDESDIVVNMALDDSTNLSSENDTSLWTNSRGYTELMQRLFDKLWGESLDAKDAVHSVKLGVVVPETSAIYEREQIFKKELDLINSAKSRVILLMSSSMVPKLLSEPLASALNDCMRTNVKVRVMTNFNEQKLGELQAVSETHDLRFVDFKISIETLAIDNSATLVTSGANEGEGEVAFWTSQREYSELVCNFLEQAWSNAHNPSQYFLHASLTKNLNMGLKQIGEELEKKGWAVSTPGVIEGGSAVNHTFKMVASNQGEVVAIDYFLSNEPVGTQPLIAYGAKKSDARLNRIILLLSPEADEEAARLAKFFGIDVIEGTDASLLLSGARNMLGLG